MSDPKTTDVHPRIWVQPLDVADEESGPTWYHTNIWGAGATEYVLAPNAVTDDARTALILFEERQRGFQEAIAQLRKIGREGDWDDPQISQVLINVADVIESVGCSPL